MIGNASAVRNSTMPARVVIDSLSARRHVNGQHNTTVLPWRQQLTESRQRHSSSIRKRIARHHLARGIRPNPVRHSPAQPSDPAANLYVERYFLRHPIGGRTHHAPVHKRARTGFNRCDVTLLILSRDNS